MRPPLPPPTTFPELIFHHFPHSSPLSGLTGSIFVPLFRAFALAVGLLPRKPCSWISPDFFFPILQGSAQVLLSQRCSPSPSYPQTNQSLSHHLSAHLFCTICNHWTHVFICLFILCLPSCEPQESRDLVKYWIPRTANPDLGTQKVPDTCLLDKELILGGGG